MIRTIASTLALSVTLLAGCGGSEDPGKPEAVASTTTATPEQIKVSDATTCTQLFGNGEPLKKTADIIIEFSKVETIDNTTLDAAQIKDLSETMSDIASRASDSLAPSLELMVSKLDKIADLVENPAAESVKLSDFQAAGYEVTNVCKEYPDALGS
jgi:hypothetical protein